MGWYKDLTFWQNSGRRQTLLDFRDKLEKYYAKVRFSEFGRGIIDNEKSLEERRWLSNRTTSARQLVTESGVGITYEYYAPPVSGGRRMVVDIFSNLFNLHHYDMDVRQVLDIIDRAIGVYEEDFPKSILRTFSPLFWLGKVLELISTLPFYLLGSIGFNQRKLEESFIGGLVKWFIKLATIIVLAWELLARFRIIPGEFDLLRLLKGGTF